MKSIYALFGLLLIVSCSPSNKESETEQLKQRIAELEAQLEECQTEDSRILDRVIDAYHDENYDSVKILYAELQRIYPDLHDLREAMDLHYKVITEENSDMRAIVQKEAADKKAIDKLKSEREGNTTIYSNSTFTHFNDRNLLSIYIKKDGNKSPVLMMKISYKGNDWIHFKKASLSYGNQSIEIPFDPFEHKETKKDAGVIEWVEVPISTKITSFLRPFSRSASGKVKLSGKHTESRTISPRERQAISDVLDGFEALKATN